MSSAHPNVASISLKAAPERLHIPIRQATGPPALRNPHLHFISLPRPDPAEPVRRQGLAINDDQRPGNSAFNEM